MNKTELIAAVAEKTGIAKKDAEAAVKAVTDTIAAELIAGNKVQLDFEVVMIDHTQTPAVETEINIDSEVTRGGLLTINYSE